MAFVFEATIYHTILGLFVALWLIIVYMKSDYSYWKKRSIAYVDPTFPFGTDTNFLSMKQQIGNFYDAVYKKFKNEKVVGMLRVGRPYLVIREPELMKQILTKDFSHFVDRGFIDSDHLKPTSKSMLHLKGDAWRTIRTKLSPAFTSGKMKMMFYLMEACANELIIALEPIAANNSKIAVKEYIARSGTDVIASCAFGLQSNSVQNPDSEFRANGKIIVDSSPTMQTFKLIIGSIFPWLIKLFPFDFASSDVFMKLIGDTIAYREKNGPFRNDFIDILIKIKNNKNLLDDEKGINTMDKNDLANGKPGLTLEEMTAQSVLFFVAGFESGSSTIAFVLYEMSLNPESQTKTRKEIDEVLSKYNGKLSYEALHEMIYMDAVINATRFVMMQMKSCLSLLLHNYEVTITEDTIVPITLSKKHFITTPEYPIILKISKRTR